LRASGIRHLPQVSSCMQAVSLMTAMIGPPDPRPQLRNFFRPRPNFESALGEALENCDQFLFFN
jgi:hypothetical protein